MCIEIDLTNISSFVNKEEILAFQPFIEKAHRMLNEKTGLGSEYLGWLELPERYDRKEFSRIKQVAEKIKNKCDVFIVIGIGGSYLGARAAIEMLNNSFYNSLNKDSRKTPEIYFVGNNLSSTYIQDLMEYVEHREVCVNVISKSGTTTEPAIAFRIIKDFLENKYGKEGAKERIIATTDKEKGALKKLSISEGYDTFIIPDDIGGRFSVLTAVGLLPMAVAGIDIEEIMKGAYDAEIKYSTGSIENNAVYKYAAARNLLYKKGKCIEMMENYEPALHYFCQWWKQLYGESEGKEGKGIFPTSADLSTDLHSMGQYIQDGLRILFETVLVVEKPRKNLEIKESTEDLDGLNFLRGKQIDFVNQMACKGTIKAHTEGAVPNIIINIPELNPYYFGNLVYFFELACAISGYLLGVNPFDQPGVEAYKKNMFALLGKPESLFS